MTGRGGTTNTPDYPRHAQMPVSTRLTGPVTSPDSRSGADRFMRRMLGVTGDPVPGAILGAQRLLGKSLVISAARCTLTYLVIPVLAPVLGLAGVLTLPVSLILTVVAMAMAISGLRRFWLADHRARWQYTIFIVIVLGFLVTAFVLDLVTLLSA